MIELIDVERLVNGSSELSESGTVPGCEAVCVLQELGLEDAEERVEWYNALTLNADDIWRLANVIFSVVECDRCGERIFVGEPDNWRDFQGVLQGEVGPIEIEGKTREVCSVCYGYLTSI